MLWSIRLEWDLESAEPEKPILKRGMLSVTHLIPDPVYAATTWKTENHALLTSPAWVPGLARNTLSQKFTLAK
jgi:hypothetical protein